MSFAQGITQVMFFALIALYRRGESGLRKAWSVICIVILCIAVILSFSRGAWTTLILSGAVYIALNQYISLGAKLKVVVALVVAIVTAAAVIWVVSPEFYTAMQRFVTSPFIAADKAEHWTVSNEVRIAYQRMALDLWLRHPVLGVGPDNYCTALGLSPLVANAHNFYLQAAAETGTAGLVGYLAVIVIALHYAYRASRRAAAEIRPYAFALFVGLLAVSVHNMFQSYNYAPKVAIGWWMAAGLCGALAAIGESE